MRRHFGWRYVDDEGTRWQVVVHVHAGLFVWTRQSRRFDPWETFEPTPEYWQAFLPEAERFFGRGKMSATEWATVQKSARAD